jgi:hypothetical protein
MAGEWSPEAPPGVEGAFIMFNIITTRVALLAAGIVGLAGLSGTARADVLFTNLTSQTLHFSVSCAGSGRQRAGHHPHPARQRHRGGSLHGVRRPQLRPRL